jgi:hypothetical protein
MKRFRFCRDTGRRASLVVALLVLSSPAASASDAGAVAPRDRLATGPTHVAPDGRTLAVCRNESCATWDVTTGHHSSGLAPAVVAGFRPPGGGAASTDGSVRARVEKGEIVVERTGSGPKHLLPTGPNGPCVAVGAAVDARGERVAGACANGTLALWEASTGRFLANAPSAALLSEGQIDVALGERGVVVMQSFPETEDKAFALGAVLLWPSPEAPVQMRSLDTDRPSWCAMEPRGRWILCGGFFAACSVASAFTATVVGDTKLDWYERTGEGH